MKTETKKTRTIKDLLSEHAFFHHLSEKNIDFISGCGKNVHFGANEYLAEEGKKADTFYVIKKGKVAIELHIAGKGAVVLQTVGTNDVIGFSWILPPHKFMFDLRTIESTSLIAMDGKCLRDKCDKDPQLGYELMKHFARMMSERLQATRLQLVDIYASR